MVYTLVPMVVMLVMSIWAMGLSMIGFWQSEKWSLLGVSVAVLAMSLWLIVEGLLAFGQGRPGARRGRHVGPIRRMGLW